jgi:hypothetical protein
VEGVVRMKKVWNYLFFTAAVLVLSIGLFPKTAHAEASYEVVDVRPGVDTDIINYKPGTETQYLYKITVPEGTYTKIETTVNIRFRFYSGYSQEDGLDESDCYNNTFFENETVHYRAFKPGDYYLHFFNTDEGQFKVSHISVSKEKNYCMKRAKALKKGKKIIIAQAYGYECDKWFKFTLTRKQKVKFTYRCLDDDVCNSLIDVYKPKSGPVFFDSIRNPRNTYTFTSKKALPKGTYYMYIRENGVFGKFPSEDVYSLTWE